MYTFNNIESGIANEKSKVKPYTQKEKHISETLFSSPMRSTKEYVHGTE